MADTTIGRRAVADVQVLLSPAELPGLREQHLQDAVCVVFDVLRATSTMVTALAHGAEAIVPVAEIDEALVPAHDAACLSDAARIAHRVYAAYAEHLADAARESRNGARLLALPELQDDVPLCFARDRFALVARMDADGSVRRIR